MNAVFAIPGQLVSRLDSVSDLLPVLMRTTDAADAFRGLAESASDIGHDEAYLGIFNGSGSVDWTAGVGDAADVCAAKAYLPAIDRGVARLLTIGPNPRGFRTGVYAPIRLDDEIAGVVLFLARRHLPDERRALTRVESIAALVAIALAHQRLTIRAPHASGPDVVAAVSDELLRTMSDALDIREIFPRVSEIVSRLVPHDRLTMAFHDGEGNLDIQATSSPDGSMVDHVKIDDTVTVPDDGVMIIGDLAL